MEDEHPQHSTERPWRWIPRRGKRYSRPRSGDCHRSSGDGKDVAVAASRGAGYSRVAANGGRYPCQYERRRYRKGHQAWHRPHRHADFDRLRRRKYRPPDRDGYRLSHRSERRYGHQLPRRQQAGRNRGQDQRAHGHRGDLPRCAGCPLSRRRAGLRHARRHRRVEA
jgi:hypothetical protein